MRKKSPEVVVMRRHQHGQVRPHEGLCETTESCTASAPDTKVSACHLQQLIGGWAVPLLEKSSNSVLLPVCHMVGRSPFRDQKAPLNLGMEWQGPLQVTQVCGLDIKYTD